MSPLHFPLLGTWLSHRCDRVYCSATGCWTLGLLQGVPASSEDTAHLGNGSGSGDCSSRPEAAAPASRAGNGSLPAGEGRPGPGPAGREILGLVSSTRGTLVVFHRFCLQRQSWHQNWLGWLLRDQWPSPPFLFMFAVTQTSWDRGAGAEVNYHCGGRGGEGGSPVFCCKNQVPSLTQR